MESWNLLFIVQINLFKLNSNILLIQQSAFIKTLTWPLLSCELDQILSWVLALEVIKDFVQSNELRLS